LGGSLNLKPFLTQDNSLKELSGSQHSTLLKSQEKTSEPNFKPLIPLKHNPNQSEDIRKNQDIAID